VTDQQTDVENPLERLLFFIASAVLALVLLPVVTLLVAGGLTEILVAVGLSKNDVAAVAFATISGVVVGLATSALVAWKSHSGLRKILSFTRLRLPEPIPSCIEFGVVGALVSGGAILAVILLLGHTRPEGWDLDRILPSMGLGFALFLLAGLSVGLMRRHSNNQ